MTLKTLSEEELKKRLKKAGKKEKEIEELLTEYTQTSSKIIPDNNVISELLRKNQEEAILRVKSFSLTRDQYDALNNYFSDSSSDEKKPEAFMLVQRALIELIKIIQ